MLSSATGRQGTGVYLALGLVDPGHSPKVVQEPVVAFADLVMDAKLPPILPSLHCVLPCILQEPVDAFADLYMDAGSVLLNVGQPDKALPFFRCGCTLFLGIFAIVL